MRAVLWPFAAFLSMGCWLACRGDVDTSCNNDQDCGNTSLVCVGGKCTHPPCNPPCANGSWCNGDSCVPCNSSEHCGTSCDNCLKLSSNHACLGERCGCWEDFDCAGSEICSIDQQCISCTPDCSNKCDGAADGCGGTCQEPCPPGQWCNYQRCSICKEDFRCGADCTDCTFLGNNKVCIASDLQVQCGCRNKSDCAQNLDCQNNICTACQPNCKDTCGGAADSCATGGTCLAPCPAGKWCDNGQCKECNEDAHCAARCLDCSAQSNNRACVSGGCGCNSDADCRLGETCRGNQRCTGCTPDCFGKCGEAPDGCGGTCATSCAAGQWCNVQQCVSCNTSGHCGSGSPCLDCASQQTNKACRSGQCGCFDDSDCLTGEKCGIHNFCCIAIDCNLWCNGGADGCGGFCPTTCPAARGTICNVDSKCVCRNTDVSCGPIGGPCVNCFSQSKECAMYPGNPLNGTCIRPTK